MSLRVELPDPNVRRTWAKQMSLEQLDNSTFRSLAGAPFGGNFRRHNGEYRPRAFGGHVYAQAMYAASKTVPKDFSIHSVTGYFTIIGLADEPFTYKVQTVREGKNYIVKRVDCVQEDGVQICFTNLCSFKKTEDTFLNIQVPKKMEEKWAKLLDGRKVEDLPLSSNFKDLREAYEKQVACITTIFPGMYTSILPLEALHKEQKPIFRQNLYIYSTVEDDEASSDDPHLDAAGHLYHSDRESVWSVVRQYELLDILDSAASLSHTVVFHTGLDKLRFRNGTGRNWYFLESGSKRVADGRVMHKGRVYDRDGNHLISTFQDGAIRLRFKDEEEKDMKQGQIMNESKL